MSDQSRWEYKPMTSKELANAKLEDKDGYPKWSCWDPECPVHYVRIDIRNHDNVKLVVRCPVCQKQLTPFTILMD